MRIHCLENVDKALQFLKEQRVHLENMGSHDIVDGNHRLTLGLIWTIILRFQVELCAHTDPWMSFPYFTVHSRSRVLPADGREKFLGSCQDKSVSVVLLTWGGGFLWGNSHAFISKSLINVKLQSLHQTQEEMLPSAALHLHAGYP